MSKSPKKFGKNHFSVVVVIEGQVKKLKNFRKKLFFRHFICYLYEGQNKIKNFCFQGCRNGIFCTTYIEGERKIFIKKGLEYPKNPKSNLPCVAAHALLAIPQEWQAKQI